VGRGRGRSRLALQEEPAVAPTTRNTTDDPLSGKTLRWRFDDGPTAGTEFEHHFYADGTVSYRTVDSGSDSKKSDGKSDANTEKPEKPEASRPKYKAFKVTDDVVVASYLGEQGFTLTVALSFSDGRVVGFASNDKQWFPCSGTFEDVTEGHAAKAG
jgi:hypothetical protein